MLSAFPEKFKPATSEEQIRAVAKELVASLPERSRYQLQLYHTCGFYSDGSSKSNQVLQEYLEDHIVYNVVMRFGRSLHIDGVCVYRGYMSPEECQANDEKIKSWNVQLTKSTHPYH